MAKQEQYNSSITEFESVLHTDNELSKQPKSTHRFALNAIDQTVDGYKKGLSNEMSNYSCTTRPSGYEVIGERYIGDDTSALILTNPATGQDEIALLTKDNKYNSAVNTSVLGLKITNQCDIIFRIRRGRERVIYWVDANNKPRTFNFDRPHNFYNQTYQAYLRAGGNPLTFVGEKWDVDSFDLIKSYTSVPFFNNVQILESGSILPGSYNFAIQYVDEDLNPTEWISTSNTVNIYNDSTSLPYHKIRGSRNVTTSSQSFPRASKTIKLTITNLDTSFLYYRIAIIRAAGNNGEPDKVLLSDLFSTSDSNFLYTGNDSSLKEGSLGEILIDKEIIFAPQHIEQLENRLILANTKGKSVDWCNFQKFASKISADLTTKEVLLNNVLSEPNVKNAKSTFLYRGYMPGEVYSFGIVYLFADGFTSPAFHIPGKSITNLIPKMKGYEIDNKYLDVHNCSTNTYWGLDSEGHTLVAKKTRHHRFPFRKDVSKPLYGSTGTVTNLNKFRLKITIALNPAWTPGPIAYPLDVNGDPIIIPYTFNYQISGSSSTSSYSGQLVDTDMGVITIIYDDVISLNTISGPNYILLDPASILATYQTPGNERFIVTNTYETYITSSSFNDDKSEIFGIEFSNIEKPRADVVGFYIVRNERLDDDKLIVDNAIFGPMTAFDQYRSFGLIMPKQYYHANNCGRQGDSGKVLHYSDKSVWFFNPEYEYLGKKTEYDRIEIEGTYAENTVSMPTISNVTGSQCNDWGTKGVYINDVQAGTSYDPNINKKKDKDDDGFDLVVGYRNTTLSYAINNTTIFPAKKRSIYLNAASYRSLDSLTYYNVSVDNKIGMHTFDIAIPASLFYNTITKKNSLLYGSLVKDNTTAYSNFISRPYYKEHSNPILFGTNNIVNNIKVFNGDTQISGFNFVSSVFYDMVLADRAKKSKVWKIVLGSLLIVGAVAAEILTLGIGTPILAAAVSLGVSLVASGIKFEQMKSMIDTDYDKGLKETVTDGGVFETIRDTLKGSENDDTIRWFSDRVSNIYIESSVPFGLRSGLNSGVTDFIDAPAPYDEQEFRAYIIEKFTILDNNQGSGRLYKGYASSEVYDMNPDYSRFNKQKLYTHLPLEYDCCSDQNEIFPLRRWFSEQSFQEEKIDNYAVFLPNNYSDMEGEHGEITDMYRFGNNLYMHTREALWQQPANLQERVSGEIVSFIGTGEFLSLPPKKIVDDNLGSAGTQHKWATIKTLNGVIFVNEIENSIYLHSDRIHNLTSGNVSWFKNNLVPNLESQLFNNFGIVYPYANNPSNPFGVGYISTYDSAYNRVLITKRDYALTPEALASLVVLPTDQPVSVDDITYNPETGYFYIGSVIVPFTNTEIFENRSWTMSFSFDANQGRGGFIGWHSYIPNIYIRSQNNLYSVFAGDSSIYKHHLLGNYQTYKGIRYPFIIEYITGQDLLDKMIEDLVLHTRARKYNSLVREFVDDYYTTFNKILLFNSRQSTGEQLMVVKDTRANPQDWYMQQTKDIGGSVIISREGKNWNLNNFRDYIDDYTKPLFSRKWQDIRTGYFIDKVVNPSIINLNKPWEQVLGFKDKYIAIRLKFDNFDDVNLTLTSTLETEQVAND